MNDNSKTIAIVESEIDKKMLDVIDCSNKVKSIFNKIDDAIEKLKSEYQCAAASTLYNQYEQFNDSYSVIVNNILSYNSDLMALKRRYATSIDDLSSEINVAAARMEAGAHAYKEER